MVSIKNTQEQTGTRDYKILSEKTVGGRINISLRKYISDGAIDIEIQSTRRQISKHMELLGSESPTAFQRSGAIMDRTFTFSDNILKAMKSQGYDLETTSQEYSDPESHYASITIKNVPFGKLESDIVSDFDAAVTQAATELRFGRGDKVIAAATAMEIVLTEQKIDYSNTPDLPHLLAEAAVRAFKTTPNTER